MHDKGRHQRVGGFRDVDIAKDGESPPDGPHGNRIDTTNGVRKISLV